MNNNFKETLYTREGKPSRKPFCCTTAVTTHSAIYLVSTCHGPLYGLRIGPAPKDPFRHRSQNLIPDIQFGFREKHATTEQVHRVVHKIAQVLENKEFAPAIFLEVSSAFNKVWYHGSNLQNTAVFSTSTV